MGITQQLEQGQVLDNQALIEIFKCSPQGGMRRSLKTNTLVVVSNHVESIYDDRWIEDTFHYTGMGQKGDQGVDLSNDPVLVGPEELEWTSHSLQRFVESLLSLNISPSNISVV